MNSQVISSSHLPDSVSCPTSKSYANRLLILAALSEEELTIKNIPYAQDVIDMINVLVKLGLEIVRETTSVTIKNSFPQCEKKASDSIKLSLGEGGTTVRFLLPLIALGQNKYEISVSDHMSKRPMRTLYSLLESLGAEVVVGENCLCTIKGPININNEVVDIDCSKTTQFASGLMHLKIVSNLEIRLLNVESSKKYLDLTQKMIDKVKNNYKELTVEPDFSSAGYFIAYGLINQNIIINNIFDIDRYQADATLLNLIKSVGGDYSIDSFGLNIKKIKKFTKGFDLDGGACIDLVPTLMFIASFIPCVSVFRNIETLIHKESNRLDEMMKILNFFNVKYKYEKNEFRIFPSQPSVLNKQTLKVANDHRMVMVSSLFFKTLGGGEVYPKESVKKSFPNFFEFFT